jgi:hypothetical protein
MTRGDRVQSATLHLHEGSPGQWQFPANGTSASGERGWAWFGAPLPRVEKRDGAEPRARCAAVVVAEMFRAAEAVRTAQRLDLIQKNPRHRRDGRGPVFEHSPQPLRQ